MDSLSCIVPTLSVSKIGISAILMISPVSIPSSINIIVTPVFLSPFIIAHWIGAEPRYLGRIDAWTLTQPFLGKSKTSLGIIWP